MKNLFRIIIVSLLFASACKKKKTSSDQPTPQNPVVENPSISFKCEDIPKAPEPFGWQDSVPANDKSVNAFLYDPIDSDKMILVVNAEIPGFRTVYTFHIPTKTTKYICTLGDFLMQVNSKGWITYSDTQNNIYLIKNNADSVITISGNNHSLDPKWDYTGNFIYYFSEAYDNIPAKMFKVNTKGEILEEIWAEFPYTATFKKSNKMIRLKLTNSLSELILYDLDHPGSEKTLISGPIYSKPGQVYFDNLTLDKTDENFYWSNSYGIFKCNVSSLKVDTLFKSCENSIYDNPIISFEDNVLNFGLKTITPISSEVLYYQYKALELNLITKQLTEIKIYP